MPADEQSRSRPEWRGRAEELKRVRVTCGHCNNTVAMDVKAFYEEFDFDAPMLYRLLLCPVCMHTNLSGNPAPDELYGASDTTLWPILDNTKLSGLPPAIDRAYRAALGVKSIDSNAFGVLIGRLLELVCIDRGAQGGTLIQQLTDLANKGEIPGRLADMAQQLRQLRNIGAHASLGELTAAEVPLAHDIWGFLHIPSKRCSRLFPSSGRADRRAITRLRRPGPGSHKVRFPRQHARRSQKLSHNAGIVASQGF